MKGLICFVVMLFLVVEPCLAFDIGSLRVKGANNRQYISIALDLSQTHDKLTISPKRTHAAMLGKCQANSHPQPVKCDVSNSTFVLVPMLWRCGAHEGTHGLVHIPKCKDSFMFETMTFVLDLGFSKAPDHCEQILLGTSMPQPHKCILTRTGRPVSLNIHDLSLAGSKNVLDLPLIGALAQTAALLGSHQITVDPVHMESTPDQACLYVQSQRHLFISDFSTVDMISAKCANVLDKAVVLPHHDDSFASPGEPFKQFVPHVELLEEGTYKLHVVTASGEAAHNLINAPIPNHVTVSDIDTAKRHQKSLEAARHRASTWLRELEQQRMNTREANAVGHKLCVHALTRPIKEGLLDKHDIGTSAGTAVQLQITEAVMDQMKLKSKGILGMIVSPIVGIVVKVVSSPFQDAFDAFFSRLLPMVCLFLLMLLLHILFKYGMNELPNAINRPCGSIIVMFLGWPVILVVVMTIYARIGIFIYRNVRLYILRDSVPQIAEPAAHHLTHSLTHSLTTSLGHTLSHSLTHTLSHSLSNSVFHFYRCSYCYHYGDQCDQCFYYRDYSWQWRMSWQGNPTMQPQ